MGNLIKSNQDSIPSREDVPVSSQSPPGVAEQFDIRRLWTVLARRRFLILLVASVVLVPTAVYNFVVTPTFRSTVRVQIDPEAVKVLPYSGVSDSVVRATPDFELYMKTQDVLLKSPALAKRAVDKLQKEYGDQKLPLIGGFSDGLGIERVAGSQIVSLHYLSFDSQFSALAANTLAEEFIKLHFERKMETTNKATDFLDDQLRVLKANVEEAEAELVEYAQRNDILDTNENQQNVIRERYGQLSNDVSRLQSAYLEIKAEYDELLRVRPDEFPASLRTPAISNLEGSVRSTEQELSRLLTQFGESWPKVVRTRNDLDIVRRQLEDEKISAIERARRDARFRLDTAQGSYQVLNRKFREQESLVYRLNEATILYNSLQRDLDAGEQLYQGLLQRLKETSVSPGLGFGNIHVTDSAMPNRKPYQPRPLWNIGLALILGISAGTALVFLLDYLDTSARGPADLELMGIPVLGWIPDIPKLKRDKRTALETRGGMESSTLQLGGTGSSLSFPSSELSAKDLRVREVYRSLCASLLLSKAEKPAKTILVTSAVPREGKTTTLSNIGIELAETGAPTLLIDSDFRNPSLSRRFGEENGKGLSVHLAGGELDIRETELPNLYLLPAGPAPPNPVALFMASRFVDTLTLLSQRFQFILIDSPPVLSVAESSILASKVDGIILVVRAAKTPAEIISRANNQLRRAGACILGAAINRLDLRDPEYTFFSKYYYDQRYFRDQPSEAQPSAKS